MQRRSSFALAAFLFASLSFTACSNQNGAGGTVDGTDEDNYQLNQGPDAAPMDSVNVATPEAPPATTTAADSTPVAK